uniref:Uncharacterized protein n=1 Tax=Arundo donax TaxID=35708 RepID=A0A0A8Y8V6_ARUDO
MAYMSSWYMANILSLVMSRMRRQAVMLTGGTLFLTGFITLAIYPAAPIIGTILLVFGVGLTAQV